MFTHFYWTIVISHFEFSNKYKHVYPFFFFFLIEKDLPLVTLDSPQFQFSVSCYLEILDLYIFADFGFG